MTTADLNTKAGYEAITKANPELIDNMVTGIRRTAEDRMLKYRGTFSNPEMAEMTFFTIRGYADALRLPQLYLYADKPDASGIKPIDAYDSHGNPMRIQIIQAAIHAEELQRTHYSNLVALEDRDNKKKINNAMTGLFSTQKALGRMTGKEALAALEGFDNAVWKMMRMPGVTHEDLSLAEKLQKNARNQAGHPEYTDVSYSPMTGRVEPMTNEYWRLFVQDKLTVDRVLGDQHKLSLEDSGFWLDKVGREQLSRKHKSDDKDLNAWDNAKIQLDKTEHELREWYNPTIGGMEMDPINGSKNHRTAKNMLIELYVDYAREHNGLAPTREEQDAMVETVKKKLPRPERKAVTNYKTHDDNGRLIIPPTREAYAEVAKYYTDKERIEILKKLSAEGK
jgi:hypothetical protein